MIVFKQQLIRNVCCLAICFLVTGVASAQKPLAIKGGKIITMAGETIENGTILFRDGKITDIGQDLTIPVEARIIDATGKVIMPGFVEAHSSEGMSQANETNPMVPYVSVMDSIDPMDSYFQEARRNGVTSVAITPGNTTMIGGQAAVIKTGGEFVDDMVLKSDAGIKISLRPVSGSRMSHLAKLRKAFDDAKKKMDKEKDGDKKTEVKKENEKAGPSPNRRRRGQRNGEGSTDKPDDKTGADEKQKSDSSDKSETPEKKPPSELDKAMFALLSGKLPAIFYCDKAMDVGQALRLIEDYELKATLVLGQDCYKAAQQVAKSGLPVILDSTLVFWEKDERTQEEKKIVVPQVFRDEKAKFAFQTARGGSNTLGDNYLWYQAATAVKYGMPEQEALEALTILPAKFLGIESYVGTIEKGKDGDVVILSGDPLKVNTWVETTVVNGEVVYERDEDEQLKRLMGHDETSKSEPAKRTRRAKPAGRDNK